MGQVLRRRAAISTRYFGADAYWDPRPATMKITGDPQLPAVITRQCRP